MAFSRNITENFNWMSRAHERYQVQTTDRRISDDIYSEREREFTFAKKPVEMYCEHLAGQGRSGVWFSVTVLLATLKRQRGLYVSGRDTSVCVNVCVLKKLQRITKECVDTRRQTSKMQSEINHKVIDTLMEKLKDAQVCPCRCYQLPGAYLGSREGMATIQKWNSYYVTLLHWRFTAWMNISSFNIFIFIHHNW